MQGHHLQILLLLTSTASFWISSLPAGATNRTEIESEGHKLKAKNNPVLNLLEILQNHAEIYH